MEPNIAVPLYGVYLKAHDRTETSVTYWTDMCFLCLCALIFCFTRLLIAGGYL